MDRRSFMGLVAASTILSGCRSNSNYAHILHPGDMNLVGSHKAGAAVWYPLVDETVAKLMGHCLPATDVMQHMPVQQSMPEEIGPGQLMPASHQVPASPSLPLVGTQPATVCFIGIENRSAEDLCDFKDQLYERIDSQISTNPTFKLVSRRMVDAALMETRLRPDSLFLPTNRELFSAALGRQGSPVDFLLCATITSGTTERNHSTQRDYLLTLEVTNVHTGEYFKESSTLRKGYHGSRLGKWWQYGPFQQGDG